MNEALARVTYQGSTPGADANTYTLFDTTTYPMKGFLAMAGLKRFIIDLEHDQAGSLRWAKSENRGTTWIQLAADEAIAAPAANTTTIRDFYIEPYGDWRLQWINGGAAQGVWIPSMVVTDERSIAT